MTYTIVYRPSARKALLDLPDSVTRRIEPAIDALAANPRPIGVKKVAGSRNLHRIRVGAYRVVYEIHDDIITVVVVRIGNRRDVYRSM